MKHPTEVFDEWAIIGKDKGMETSHSASVSEILDFAISQMDKNSTGFKFLDFGCGNGWVADKISKNNCCSLSMGIDGAKTMIINAEKRKSEAVFLLKDLNSFELNHKFDLIFSMEVFIMGVDHYFENEESHDWQEKVGTRMHMFKEREWLDFFKKSDFKNVYSWRANSNDWAGTLVITGTN